MMSNSSPIIQFNQVYQRYDTSKKPVLNNINIEINKGDFCMLLGLSGSGKSTMLRCINGFVQPYDGEIIVDGIQVTKNKDNLNKIRPKVGMIFQEFNLVNRLTALENVICGMLPEISNLRALFKKFKKEDINRGMQLLDRVGLAEFADTRVDLLSGGQKQRVGIARALAQDPDILLADEPVASLDPQTSESILELLMQISREEQLTCIISIHQLEYAKKYGKRIIGLNQGNIKFDSRNGNITADDAQLIYGPRQSGVDRNERN